MKFKEGASVMTDDFWYDLFDGGNIKPEKLLENADAYRVNQAVHTLELFRAEAEKQGVLEEY